MQQPIRKYYDVDVPHQNWGGKISTTENEPAMPTLESIYHNGIIEIRSADLGFTKKEQACLDLCLPESGTEWLDKLILKKQRQSIAAQVLNGMLANPAIKNAVEGIKSGSIYIADTLIAELNKKP